MVLQEIQEGFILCMLKRFSILLVLILIGYKSQAQGPNKCYNENSFLYTPTIDSPYKNKTILPQFTEAITLALRHYPELQNTTIIFKQRKQNSPLSTHISLLSMLRNKKKRTYIVVISDQSKAKLQSILLSKLSFDAQVGVLGHELAHIAEFVPKSFFYFIRLALKHLSIKQMDAFENHTDVSTIRHNLGFQLLSWSKEVRHNLNHDFWGGSSNPKRNRYLNPSQIQAIIDSSSIYNHND